MTKIFYNSTIIAKNKEEVISCVIKKYPKAIILNVFEIGNNVFSVDYNKNNLTERIVNKFRHLMLIDKDKCQVCKANVCLPNKTICKECENNG